MPAAKKTARLAPLMSIEAIHARDAALAAVRDASKSGKGLLRAVAAAKKAGANPASIEKAINGRSWG